MDVRVIYIDELFILNAAIDYVLLICSAKIAGVGIRRLFALFAALFGGGYAVLAAVYGGAFASWEFKLAAGVFLALIAFGGRKHFLRLTLIFFAVSAAFAGVVMAAGLLSHGTVGSGLMYGEAGLNVLIASFAAAYAVFSVAFRSAARHRVRGETVEVTVTLGDRRVTIPALVDTGNTLRDPMTGRDVVICSLDAVLPLLPSDAAVALTSRLDAGERLRLLSGTELGSRFSLVPFSSLGGGGLMTAFRPDAIYIAGRKKFRGLIAIGENGVFNERGYSALVGAE